jgi:hypothetical protein
VPASRWTNGISIDQREKSMQSLMRKLSRVTLIALSLVLTACGGGGGGGDSSISPAQGAVTNTNAGVTTTTHVGVTTTTQFGVTTTATTTTTTAGPNAPAAPVLSLAPQGVKTFRFAWADVTGETEYRLLEQLNAGTGYTQVATIPANAVNYELAVFLPRRINARYVLQACNGSGCADSAPVTVSGNLAAAAGYVKASNTNGGDEFGYSVALAADGNTLAVGAYTEDSAATGVNGNQTDNSATDSGAVYIFTRNGGIWNQQAYLKASNADVSALSLFGYSVALSADGNTLAVGAPSEDSGATGVNGNQRNGAAPDSGAVYVFSRNGTAWSQQAYVKASNTDTGDWFGISVALSGDGNTLAAGAYGEDSAATGVNGNQADNSALDSGAVYIFTRSGTTWSQQAYIKASNANEGDSAGNAVALSADGNTLAIGAYGEDSNGNPTDNSMLDSGAVYVFTRTGNIWSQQAYIKASNAGDSDWFGYSIALAADGNTLAVGAYGEDSAAAGVNGNQGDNSAGESGAVYVYTRNGGGWSQQAYIKASNASPGDWFGTSLALAADGNTLMVGAAGEDSAAAGINGNQVDNSATDSGAVYIFTRNGGAWSQQAYIKAPNPDTNDWFGMSAALSADGNTLAVGASREDSGATGMNGNQTNNAATSSGAVYLY